MRSPVLAWPGARAQVGVALDAALEGVSGKYFADQTFKLRPGTYAEETVVVSKLAENGALVSMLWDYSQQATGSNWDALRAAQANKNH